MNPQKLVVKEALLRDQHFLCAYTERAIDVGSAHIDHVVPRSVSPEDELEFSNLVAAYPRDSVVDGQVVPYGAHHRGSAVLPVTPLEHDCDTHFRFSPTGRIIPITEAGVETIAILNLNAGPLLDLRRAAVAGAIEAIGRGEDLSMGVANGRLPEFASTLSTLLGSSSEPDG
jgi:uncharacterized protein (TIGR02646 family)